MIFSQTNKIIFIIKGWIILRLVSKEDFKEMMELGFIKQGDFTQTMKNHSKSRRHKKYVVEYKHDKYLKYKANQNEKVKNKI
jgi:hypothetical protein